MSQPPKEFELIYSRQATGFVPGRAYSNPRFYTRPREGVTKVYLVGDWPKIEADYKALGVPVERLDAPPALDDSTRDTVVRNGAARFVSDVPQDERAAIEIPADWSGLSWPALRGLATKLSDTPVLNKADATAAIEAELARRSQGDPALTKDKPGAA
jgi:hypothetical protein